MKRKSFSSIFVLGQFSILICLVLIAPAQAQDAYDEETLAIAQALIPPFLKIPPIETEQIGEGLYSFRWGAYRNIFLVTDDGVIATDPMGADSAGILRAEIAKITDKPVKYLVYSQSHWDHVTGGKIFKDEGAQIIAHERCATNIAARPHPDLIAPDITFSDTYSVELGGRSLDLYYFGPADDDCGIVIVPSTEPMLYITDTTNPAPSAYTIPWNPQLPDLHPHNIIPFFKSLEALGEERGLTQFIGGHVAIAIEDGKPAAYPILGPYSQIGEKRDLWERIFAAVKQEFDKGTSVEDLPNVIDQEQFSFVENYTKDGMWLVTRRIAEYYEAGR